MGLFAEYKIRKLLQSDKKVQQFKRAVIRADKMLTEEIQGAVKQTEEAIRLAEKFKFDQEDINLVRIRLNKYKNRMPRNRW